MKIINFGIVGLGHIGTRHFEEIEKNKFAKLSAICDVQNKAIGGVNEYNDISKMISLEPQIDIVSICTPNYLHFEQCCEVLYQQKHVLIEKPATIIASQILELIQISEKVQKKVFCVMQNRFSPYIKWVKQIINNNQLGKINLVQISCYWNRDESYYCSSEWKGNLKLDGGVLYTQFSHFIDIACWLFGGIKNIKSNFKKTNNYNIDISDTGVSVFEFENNIMGCLSFSTNTFNKNFEASITILGEKGSIKIGGTYMNKIDYVNVDFEYQLPNERIACANNYNSYNGSGRYHDKVIENVIATLNGHQEVEVGLRSQYLTINSIEQIYKNCKI